MYRQRVDVDLELAFPLYSDAEELFAIVKRERKRLREWLAWADVINSVDDERGFIRAARDDAAAGRAYHHVIRVDGKPGGIVSLMLSQQGVSGEIGYWLGQRCEGRGVMTRSVVAVLDDAFAHLALHRVQVQVTPANRRSRAIPERLGFRCDGSLREAERTTEGTYRALEVWSMLAHEWPACRPGSG